MLKGIAFIFDAIDHEIKLRLLRLLFFFRSNNVVIEFDEVRQVMNDDFPIVFSSCARVIMEPEHFK